MEQWGGRLGCWPVCMVEERCDRWEQGSGNLHMGWSMTPPPGMLDAEACSFVVRQAGAASSGSCCLDPELKEHMMTHWAWVNVPRALSLSG